MTYRIQVYRERGLRKWRWRRIAGNNRITETAGQGYVSKWNAKRSAHKAHPEDPFIEDERGKTYASQKAHDEARRKGEAG